MGAGGAPGLSSQHKMNRLKAESDERRRLINAQAGLLQTAFSLGTLANPRERAGGMAGGRPSSPGWGR